MQEATLNNQTLDQLETLYEKAVKRGDELLADTIMYLISEKQLQIVKSKH